MAPRYKFKRSSRGGGALTAASSRIREPSKSFKSTVAVGGDDWQSKSWEFLERVGELAYYTSWRSKSASRCRLIASEYGDDGRPTGQCENERVNEIVRAIGGGIVGQSQILSRMTILLTVPGEGYVGMLVRSPDLETDERGNSLDSLGRVLPGEEWVTLAREEIKSKGGRDGLELTLPDGKKHTFDKTNDILFRVWNPHPRKASDADSPVRSAQDVLLEIVRTTATIANAAKSRLVGNGIVFVPQEMSLPAQNAPAGNPVGSGADPTDPSAAQWNKATTQDLQDLIYNVAKVAYDDPDSMAAFIPIFAAAPGEWIKNVQHLKFDSTVSETALKTRDKAMERLARSLDVSPERLLGVGENSNHWSAWLTDENDVKIHVAPVLETICDAFNREVLRGMLEEEGIDPDDYTVWYDTSALTEDPDLKAEASEAHERGAMTTAKYLEHLGFSDTDAYDLTTPEGLKQFATDKITADPAMIPLLAPLLVGNDLQEVKAPAQPAIEQGPADEDTTEEPSGAEQQQEPNTEDSDDPAVSAAAYGLATMCVNRALELANKRRRTRTNHSAFDGVPVHEAHVRLDKVETNDAALSLIEGWDSIIDPFVIRSSGLDPVKFGELVELVCTMSLRGSRRVAVSSNLIEAARL